ncbi:polycomb group protein EMF2B isoform X1 [Dioscorea cayenensis subsp. rotundata]|uniref:Polycomb group protein EMF2B isoform X1 n=1 Tax=Dioscorea cayennensis subsp. rotundata TaxID=55577 RepID=A0AB40CX43_DIOCR|nr:polycomb group protein EMF2B isoform X1 [Dioscorea cayenensis subsp. rotundata]XP_039144682.1 polycomb group protein EMF2B isoform X1 [Dioscorea cayenensis subsp. rotundata]
MPGLPLPACETTCSQSRTADHMCLQHARVRLSEEEALVAEESLSIYCKPVELYNILQRRAIQNPSFLQRCLSYKIQAKRKRRIRISVSFPGNVNSEVQPQNLFPLYVLLAQPDSDTNNLEHSAVYRLNRACLLTSSNEFGKRDQAEASFVIPEIKKLSADSRLGSLTLIFIFCGELEGASVVNHLLKDNGALSSCATKLEGDCFWGKLQIESLCSSLEKCVSLSLGHRIEMLSPISMQTSILMPTLLDRGSRLSFQTHASDSMSSYQVQVSICAQEIGARQRSPYDSYTYNDVPVSSLPHIMRLRTGNVLFNYRYYNNTLQKTEVTEDFSCPFCLVQCASFKGLRYHLISTHDLFNFEFWVTEEYQAVNVSVRTDTWRMEVASDDVDPRLQTFIYCRTKSKRRRKLEHGQNINHVHPHVMESNSPVTAHEDSYEGCMRKDAGSCPVEEKLPRAHFGENHLLISRHKSESCSENHGPGECGGPVTSSFDTVGFCAATAQLSTSNDCSQPLSGSNLMPPTMLQFAKTRKLSIERADPRNRALLQKRQFFHSHRAQPMALEQVFSDRDSEDEVDDDIADFEDRKMLDDFVDVTKDEKQIMHLWNSFVRKQRVLADGHIPWACEAFSRLHGKDLVQKPALVWCWRLFMVKLWNHSLLDARSMNNCNIVLERYQNERSDPPQE